MPLIDSNHRLRSTEVSNIAMFSDIFAFSIEVEDPIILYEKYVFFQMIRPTSSKYKNRL